MGTWSGKSEPGNIRDPETINDKTSGVFKTSEVLEKRDDGKGKTNTSKGRFYHEYHSYSLWYMDAGDHNNISNEG